jgi:hypothetical protein
MWKHIFAISGLIVLLALSLSGCSNKANSEIKASLNQEFRLPIGQTASIGTEGLKIKFVGVSGDSRCPQGVTCVWAGEATCQTIVTLNNAKTNLNLTVSGSSLSQTEFQNYKFVYNLEPYPQAKQTIDNNDYVLVLKVSK